MTTQSARPNADGKSDPVVTGKVAPIASALADAPFEVGEFESGGLRLYYEIHGHGPRVLVYMHGILLDANLNRRLATDLAAKGNTVILLDLPGHGLSDKP
jgi:alpha-beta hydrolase superfamily lysophospholipase